MQGVAYRANAQKTAKSIGLKGFVQNEPDGSVYAEVEGQEEAVQSFVEWCQQGPILARVSGVTTEKGSIQGFETFEIRRI